MRKNRLRCLAEMIVSENVSANIIHDIERFYLYVASAFSEISHVIIVSVYSVTQSK